MLLHGITWALARAKRRVIARKEPGYSISSSSLDLVASLNSFSSFASSTTSQPVISRVTNRATSY
ncbi:hypothetical protein PROFUN_06226 [Planoprotostelium fungivorum]|uniref:Uncharacterized protein n=1 Tax=Planoprotostelium fungivorum TaxID=1890364 RepID=A0A2P6MZ19_9EUKA|nr:hypothetical protein PROFUN_06226 [Planoprotostelium fungivorum]